MNGQFFKKKVLSPFGIALLCVLLTAASCAGTWLIMSNPSPEALTAEELYARAVKDAVFADPDEILPLVTLDEGSENVTWNAAGDKALLISWNRHPERYIAGETFKLTYGEIWTVADKEIVNWYKRNAADVTDWTRRLEQLIGLPPECGYTHVTAFWADMDELIRPAYETGVVNQLTESELDGSALAEHEAWFDKNTLWSYFYSAYPWTRLGYTYDWADNGREYGLTEFLILPDSEVEIEWTLTTDEFIDWLSAQAEQTTDKKEGAA